MRAVAAISVATCYKELQRAVEQYGGRFLAGEQSRADVRSRGQRVLACHCHCSSLDNQSVGIFRGSVDNHGRLSDRRPSDHCTANQRHS